jgi:aminopeptidase-like protein
MSLNELKKHLHTLPQQPEWIPYRTSYYREDWGFCLSHHQYMNLPEDEYEVCIDSTLRPGSLTYGELVLPGESREEVLISCHICHPSLCNENLSGIAVATFLAQRLAAARRRYCYRFLFVPGTIGAITWLAQHADTVDNIKHGLILANLGDSGGFTYKKSRRGDAEIDRVVAHILRHVGSKYQIVEFSPYGYDERQYCSPGFNLPVGCFMRTPEEQRPEYHTSADNLEYVKVDSLASSLLACSSIIDALENNFTYINLSPNCEPQLGKRGIYRAVGGPNLDLGTLSMLWVLNLSDGSHNLLDIAERSGLPFEVVQKASATLLEHGLLRREDTQ